MEETQNALNAQKLELNQTKEELRQLFQDALEAINLDLEVAKKVTAQETCGDIANLGIETSRSFTLDPINEKGMSCRVKIALTMIMEKLLVRFFSNFDISFYSRVLLKSKSRGF